MIRPSIVMVVLAAAAGCSPRNLGMVPDRDGAMLTTGDGAADGAADSDRRGPDAGADAGTPEVGADAATAEVGADAGTREGGPEVAPPPPCTTPVPGMVIRADTTLCGGTYAMTTPSAGAALTVDADHVTVTCAGTVLEGPGAAVAPGGGPTVGIDVVGRTAVTIKGCTARKFRYGATIRNSKSVTLDGLHLDDNFTDPTAGWVEDMYKGGGVRLEGVTGGLVRGCSFARNWNGIELRGTSDVMVTDNVADHCTNWGVILSDARDNTVARNDFSWAIRGDGLSFADPARWYGQDTRDSAGVVLDVASTGNVVADNDTRYGGDGIFLRAVLGPCATGNRITGNDASFSANNGIESWCDGNTFSGNTASGSNYGLWLGGSDGAVVTGNRADGNRVDGISIQAAEVRHALVQDNVLTNNRRAGLFIGGRNYQDTNPPSPQDTRVWNASHLLVQRNSFSGNGIYDVYLGTARGVLLASNRLTASKVVSDPASTAAVVSLGDFAAAAGRTAPTAALVRPAVVRAGAAATFDAGGSAPSPAGGPLAYGWLAQPAGARFAGDALPPMVLAGAGPARPSVVFPTPGTYDVTVIVNDGLLGALAQQQVTVVPGGVRVGEVASAWTAVCVDTDDCMGTVLADDPGGVDGSAVHLTTRAAFDLALVTPAARDLGLDASGYTRLGFFVRGSAPFGWQSAGAGLPQVVLGGPGGKLTYAPAATLLPAAVDGWVFIEVPLAAPAGSGWTLTGDGGSLARVDWVELHADTWDAGFELWVDAVSFY